MLRLVPSWRNPDASAMKQPASTVTSTRPFRNGNSQAVRIPKALAFDSVDIEVEIYDAQDRGRELPESYRASASTRAGRRSPSTMTSSSVPGTACSGRT